MKTTENENKKMSGKYNFLIVVLFGALALGAISLWISNGAAGVDLHDEDATLTERNASTAPQALDR